MNIKKSTAGILLGLVASSSLAYAESNPQHREMLQSSDNNKICFVKKLITRDGMKYVAIPISVDDTPWAVTGVGDNSSSESINDIAINVVDTNCIQAKATRHGSTDVTKKLLERIGNNSTIYNTGNGVTNTADFTSDSKLNLAFSVSNLKIDYSGSDPYPKVYFAQGTKKDWYVYTPDLHVQEEEEYWTHSSTPGVKSCKRHSSKSYYFLGNDMITISYGLVISDRHSDLTTCSELSDDECKDKCTT